MSKTNKNKTAPSKKVTKKRAREKANRKARNRRNNAATKPAQLELEAAIAAPSVMQTITDRYQSMSASEITQVTCVRDKLVTSSEDSIEIQAIEYNFRTSVIEHTPSIRRDQLERFAMWKKVFSSVETKVVEISGTVTDVKFGLNDDHLDRLVFEDAITQKDIDTAKANTAVALLLSSPMLGNPETGCYETFEDSHIWLFLHDLHQFHPISKTVYLGDRIDIVGEIVKYDKLTKTGPMSKWGIAKWMVLDAWQPYRYNGKDWATPSSIKRLAPLLAISHREYEGDDDPIESENTARLGISMLGVKMSKGERVVECEILVHKDEYERDKQELKKVFNKVKGDYVWVE